MFASAQNNPVVVIETNLGNMFIELFPADAPITVDNFLAYVNEGFYDGILFHRVITSGIFIIQAGGYYFDDGYLYEQTANFAPIINESYNGLSNLRGTIAMARTDDPNSATSQFFINQADNLYLDRQSASDVGYCVFGKVIQGLDVVDAIANTPVIDAIPSNPSDPFNDFPYPPMIEISYAYVLSCSLSYCSDLNADGKVNFEDFAILASHWVDDDCNSANNFCGGADFNYNGSANANDLVMFLDNWLGQLGVEPAASDFNYDGVINFKDLTIFVAHWLDSGCNPSNNFCDRNDLNRDSSVDFADFALFANNWLCSQ
jgi:cyclophilin family peptidyl-prolyl cis-trans isomerase